jgi:hypothetical protein
LAWFRFIEILQKKLKRKNSNTMKIFILYDNFIVKTWCHSIDSILYICSQSTIRFKYGMEWICQNISEYSKEFYCRNNSLQIIKIQTLLFLLQIHSIPYLNLIVLWEQIYKILSMLWHHVFTIKLSIQLTDFKLMLVLDQLSHW